jgi:restriction endonuclease S subunit
MKSFAEQIRQKGKGATREGVNSEILRKLRLPLPLLRVQQESVAHFDAVQAEADEMRHLQAQDAELLDQLEQSILEHTFRGKL